MGSFLSSFIGGSSEGSSAASDSPDNNRVKTCHSSELLHHYINETSRLVVIDFSASWCGPCKIMEPIIRAMANEITDVDFVKIDVDELSDVAQKFEVQAMPTFVLWKERKEIDRLVGARKDELKTMIQKHIA
ncbi:thioredoxin H2 [Cicer arietinum]|uniref:Thioredoxin H2 n=1 Tax=Cicer arietinum TaxID=3827 RepID=A0A1S2XGU4_CICAR|nr:thioredoxin H2 [Cicer arietinum]